MFRPWPKSRKRNKFGAQRTNGFASKLESAVYDLLKMMERAGQISNIRCQPHVRLTRAGVGYKPDFSFTDNKTGGTIWVEAKGVELEGYRLRKKLWSCYGPGPLQIFKGDHRRPAMVEVLVPEKKELICHGCGAVVDEK